MLSFEDIRFFLYVLNDGVREFLLPRCKGFPSTRISTNRKCQCFRFRVLSCHPIQNKNTSRNLFQRPAVDPWISTKPSHTTNAVRNHVNGVPEEHHSHIEISNLNWYGLQISSQCYNKISLPSDFICSQEKEHGNDANVFSKKAKRYTKKMLKESDISDRQHLAKPCSSLWENPQGNKQSLASLFLSIYLNQKS